MGRLWERYVEQLTHPFEKGNEFIENGKVKVAIIVLIVEVAMSDLYMLLLNMKAERIMREIVPEGFTEMDGLLPKHNFLQQYGFGVLTIIASTIIFIVLLYYGMKMSQINFSWQQIIKAVALKTLVDVPLDIMATIIVFLSPTLASAVSGVGDVGILYVMAGLTQKDENREKKAAVVICCIALRILTIFALQRFLNCFIVK